VKHQIRWKLKKIRGRGISFLEILGINYRKHSHIAP
jgi:hypothetical protein